ncbi:MAG: MFS transporter [bacterium]
MEKTQHPQSVDKNAALVIAAMAAFLTPFMGSSVNIALPSIGKEFSVDAVVLNWVATAYLLSAAIFLVPFGKMADIHGRKKVFTWGIAIYTLSSLLSGISPIVSILIISRIIQGVGSAMIFSTGVAILTSVFPVGERGKALGINVSMTYMGLSLGPVFGGLLTQHLGWRSVFLVNVPLGLFVLFITLLKLKGEWAESRGESLDRMGAVMFGVSLAAVMIGLSKLPSTFGISILSGGVMGILIFIRWETRIDNPLLNMNLFRRNVVFALSNLAALIHYSATFAVGFLLSLYLQYIQGFSPQKAGFVLIAQPVVMAAFSPLSGRLSDRVEPRIIASVGMSITVIGLIFLSSVNAQSAISVVILSLLLLGSGFALFSSPNMNAIMSSVERKFYGVASATLGTMRLTGQMLSMGIAMLIFSLIIGRIQISPEHYPQFLMSMKTAFIVFASMCSIGIFASLARGRVSDSKHT